MEHILTGHVLKKYHAVFLVCKETEKGCAGHQWTLVAPKDLIMDYFWTYDKVPHYG